MSQFRVQEKLTKEQIEFIAMLFDKIEFREFFWTDHKRRWVLRDYEIELNKDKNDYIVVASGRDTSKTTNLKQDIIQVALSNPGKEGAVVAPREVHLKPDVEYVINKLMGNSFFNIFVKKVVRYPDFKIEFHNGFILWARISGSSGGTNFFGLHVDFAWVEEAELFGRDATLNLQQCINRGCKVKVFGVPNDVRSTYLYQALKDPAFSKHQILAYRNPDFSKEKKARLLRMYGGEHSPMWRNQVLAEWGSPKHQSFSIEEIELNTSKSRQFEYTEFAKAEFDAEGYSLINIPRVSGTARIAITADIGYSPDPTVINIWNLSERAQHLYKIKFTGINFEKQAEIIDTIATAMDAYKIAIDIGGIGRSVFLTLLESEKYKEKKYVNKVYGVDFGSNLTVGYRTTEDDGDKKIITVRQPMKYYLTILLKESIKKKGYELMDDVELQNEMENLVESTTPSGETVYSGLEHNLTTLRCLEYVKFMEHEPISPEEKIKSSVHYFETAQMGM